MEGERVLLELRAVAAVPRLSTAPPQGDGSGNLRLLHGPEGLVLQWDPLEEPSDPTEDEDPPDPGFEPDWAVLSAPTARPHRTSAAPFRLRLCDVGGLRRGPPSLRGPPLLLLIPRGGAPCPPPLLLPRGGRRQLLRLLGGHLRACPWDPRLLLVCNPQENAAPPEPPPHEKGGGVVARLLQAPYAATLGGLSRLLGGPPPSSPPQPGVGGEGEEPPFEVIACVPLGPRPIPPRTPPVTLEEWRRSLDGEGRSLSPEPIRARIFRGGLSPEARPEVWPRLLGLRGWGAAPDPQVDRERRASLERMKLQWSTVSAEQRRRNRALRRYHSTMEQDLERCPPEVSPHMLRNVLMTFCMYHFDLGYVEGMSEVLTPLAAVCPNEVECFWGFCSIMDTVGDAFGPTQEGLQRGLAAVGQLLRVLEPGSSEPPAVAAQWLQMRFLPWVGLEGSMRLCEALWAAPPGPPFLLLITCAAIAALTQRPRADGGRHCSRDGATGEDPPLEAEALLSHAEGTLLQLEGAQELPPHIRELLALGPPPAP